MNVNPSDIENTRILLEFTKSQGILETVVVDYQRYMFKVEFTNIHKAKTQNSLM